MTAIILAGTVVPLALLLRVGSRPTPAAPTPPATGAVRCDATGVHINTTVVRAQVDGVHLRLTGAKGERLVVMPKPFRPLTPPSQTQESSAIGVFPIYPGTVQVGCIGQGLTIRDTVPLNVVDPQHYWVSPAISCTDGKTVGHSEGDRVTRPLGESGNPVALLRAHTIGLRPGDSITPAGYPQARDPVLVIRRGRRTIAFAWFQDQGALYEGHANGRWVFGQSVGWAYCASDLGGFNDPNLG